MNDFSAFQGQEREPLSLPTVKESLSKSIVKWSRKVAALLYTVEGSKNQNVIINTNQSVDPVSIASGVIFLK